MSRATQEIRDSGKQRIEGRGHRALIAQCNRRGIKIERSRLIAWAGWRGGKPTPEDLFMTTIEFTAYIERVLRSHGVRVVGYVNDGSCVSNGVMSDDTVDDAIADFVHEMLRVGLLDRFDERMQREGDRPLFKGYIFRCLRMFLMARRRKFASRAAQRDRIVVALSQKSCIGSDLSRMRDCEIAKDRVSILRQRLPHEYGEVLDALMMSDFNTLRASSMLGTSRGALWATLHRIRKEVRRIGLAPQRA